MKVLNVFNTLTLKQFFWKTKNFFKKLEYGILVETTEIENTSFHLKLLCQKPISRQIEWRLQNGPITKSGVLPEIYLENLFQFWNLLKRVNLMYQRPKYSYSYFTQPLEFNFRVLYPCEYP